MMPKEYLVLETIPKLGTGKADFAKANHFISQVLSVQSFSFVRKRHVDLLGEKSHVS
jgi:hypothetical protein